MGENEWALQLEIVFLKSVFVCLFLQKNREIGQ